MSRRDRSTKTDTPNNKHEATKPALLLFGKDVPAQQIVDAIVDESKRQLKTGDIGRRMVRIERKPEALDD
jgi:hypothetical protein